ncbi:MAG: hydrogenase 4 subunit F [Limisphaerales bacterium]
MLLLTPILIVPLLAGLLCLVVRSRRVMAALGVLAFGATVGLGIALVYRVLVCGVVTEWGGFLSADALSAWMVLLISIVSLASAIYAVGYLRRDLDDGAVTERRFREFYVLTPLFGASMFLVVLANNLGVMWAAVEATALSSVLLVALYNRRHSLEAAWKYIILGSMGLALALMGTVFVYAAACKNNPQSLSSFNWSYLMSVADQLDPRLLKLASVFAFIGYGTKAGLAPMHTWLPDAHSEAPSPTSAMLSGVSLKIALYALLRFHVLTTACLGTPFSQHLLLGFGLLSMCVATPFILIQTNMKRLFAYHSVEHMGIMCVGFGLASPLSVFCALLHVGYHALVKSTIFFAAGNIQQKYHSLELPSLSGLLKTMPASSTLLALAVIGIAGLPPFGMFLTEFSIVAGGIGAGHILASVLFVAALVTVFAGLLSHVAHLLLGTVEKQAAGPQTPLSCVAAMALLIAVLMVLSVWLPAPLLELLHQAAAIIGGKP